MGFHEVRTWNILKKSPDNSSYHNHSAKKHTQQLLVLCAWLVHLYSISKDPKYLAKVAQI